MILAGNYLAKEPHMDATSRERVLIVDDDPLIRIGTAAMLSDLGFAPLMAADAEDAIARMGAEGQVEILVTDYEMPHYTGVELATMVTAVRPLTRILVVSGKDGLERMIAPGWGLLAKPFTSQELRAALGRLKARLN